MTQVILNALPRARSKVRAEPGRMGRVSRALSVTFQGYIVNIPEGAQARRDWSASGTDEWFLTNAGLHVCSTDCPALFAHDRTYRYLFIPADAVTEINHS